MVWKMSAVVVSIFTIFTRRECLGFRTLKPLFFFLIMPTSKDRQEINSVSWKQKKCLVLSCKDKLAKQNPLQYAQGIIYLTPMLTDAKRDIIVNGPSPLLHGRNRIVLVHLVLHVCLTGSSFLSIEHIVDRLKLPNTFTSRNTTLNSITTSVFHACSGPCRYVATSVCIGETFFDKVFKHTAATAATYLSGRPRYIGYLSSILQGGTCQTMYRPMWVHLFIQRVVTLTR